MESTERDREELRPNDPKRRLREDPEVDREPEDTGGHPEEDVWRSPEPDKDPGPVHEPPRPENDDGREEASERADPEGS